MERYRYLFHLVLISEARLSACKNQFIYLINSTQSISLFFNIINHYHSNEILEMPARSSFTGLVLPSELTTANLDAYFYNHCHRY